jgi:hypothetical protein
MVSPPTFSIIHYLQLFPKVRSLRLHWRRQLSGSEAALAKSEYMNTFEDLEVLYLDIEKEEQRGPDLFQRDAVVLDFEWSMIELRDIFGHLPISGLKRLAIRAESPIDKYRIKERSEELLGALSSMDFPQLESFEFRALLDVRHPLPPVFIWVSLVFLCICAC